MARYVPTMNAVTSQAQEVVLLSAALLALADAWESCATLRRIPSPTLSIISSTRCFLRYFPLMLTSCATTDQKEGAAPKGEARPLC